MLVTDTLITRLERSDAVWLAESVVSAGGDVVELAGGVAAFLGEGHVLTQVVGFGLDGKGSEDDWDNMLRFYRGRCQAFEFKVTPNAPAHVRRKAALLAVDLPEMTSILIRQPSSTQPPPDEWTIDELPSEEVPEYLATSTPWFFPEGNPPGFVESFVPITRSPMNRTYVIRQESRYVAGAQLRISDGVGWLNGGAVAPDFRGRGIHRALIHRRIQAAVEMGCDFVAQGASPGTSSQLNAQKMGLEVAYTRPTLLLPA